MPFLAVCGEGECSQMFSPQVGRQIYGKTAAPWLLQLPPHFAIFYGQLTARMNSTELRLLGRPVGRICPIVFSLESNND